MTKLNDVSQVRVYRYSEVRDLAERSNMSVSQLVNFVLDDLIRKAGKTGKVELSIQAGEKNTGTA